MDPLDMEPLATADAAREMDARLSFQEVRRAVAGLPEEQRAVLILDLPIGTVMSRLARARLALGRLLDNTIPMPRLQGG